MGHLLPQLSLLLLLVAISGAAELTGRDYWNSVLPKTPMPKIISELLVSDHEHAGVVDISKIPKCYFSHYDLASEGHLDSIDRDIASFFLEKELHSGKNTILQFTQTTLNAPYFIPVYEANKLPFSSSEFSVILDHFKIVKDSSEAEVIKETLKSCERPAVIGEKKYCATSLESMVDFAASTLQTHAVHPLSTNANSPNAPKQEYRILQSKRMVGNELVTCHLQPYAYAVFYCHTIKSTTAYKVNLVGKDGNRVAAIAVCHMDTSSWNPKHLAFQLLKVQAGTVPICHFLMTGAVAWTRTI